MHILVHTSTTHFWGSCFYSISPVIDLLSWITDLLKSPHPEEEHGILWLSRAVTLIYCNGQHMASHVLPLPLGTSRFEEQKEIEPVKDESAQRFKDLQEEFKLYEAARKNPKQASEQVAFPTINTAVALYV